MAVGSQPIGAAQHQAGTAAEFIIAADLRTEFVVLAALGGGVVPQALLLRFLAAGQTRKMLINFRGQFDREIRGAVRMLIPPTGPCRIQQDG